MHAPLTKDISLGGWLTQWWGGIGCRTISFFHLRKVRFYSDGSSSDSVLPCHLQSHFHIHTHVRGTHAARLWVGREYPILLARTCHQRISLLHDIMALLLLLQHRAFHEPPLTLCSTTWQHPSPAHNLPGRFLPTLFPCTCTRFYVGSNQATPMPPPARTIPKSRLGRSKGKAWHL